MLALPTTMESTLVYSVNSTDATGQEMNEVSRNPHGAGQRQP